LDWNSRREEIRLLEKIIRLVRGSVVPNYATSRNVVDSRPDEVNDFVSIYLILLAALGPEVYSASNRNEYQKQKNDVSGE
jgi:hypothetical protein